MMEKIIMYVSKVEKHDKCHFEKSSSRTSVTGLRGQGQGVVRSSWVKGDCQFVSWFECRSGCGEVANELVRSIPICHQLMG